MKLKDLMKIIHDSDNVNVYDSNLTLIALYNGRDSIPATYKHSEIDSIHAATSGTINIVIKDVM